MDVMTALRTRRSIRQYSNKPVEDGLVWQLIEAAHLAPSAHNKQPWHYIVFRDQQKKKEIAAAANWAKFLPEAPVAILACTRIGKKEKIDGRDWVEWYSLQSTGAAIENLLLAAHSFGLGTCWIGDIKAELLNRLFAIPARYEPMAIIAIGYPAEDLAVREAVRRPLKEVLQWGE